MAPINFEDNIKKELEKRTLEPSADAWEKLSHRLDNEGKASESKSHYYWWVGIAASIIGVVFVVSQWGNTGSINTEQPEVVVTPEIIQENTNPIVAEEEVGIAEQEIPVQDKNIETQVVKQVDYQFEDVSQTSTITSQVAIIESSDLPLEKRSLVVDEKEELKPSETFEDEKIQDVVDQIRGLEENNTEVTSIEVDALLLKAQQEITLNQLINKNTGIVDADLLLQDVETEVDQSFRSKVFEALKESYNSVKTAVAQRND